MGWHLPNTKTSSISTRHMSGVVQVGKRKTPLLPGDILKLAPADHEGPDPAYMVLLPTPAENRCVARCVILYDDGSLKPDFISEHSHLLRHAAPIDVPQHLTQRVLEVLDDPPTHGLFGLGSFSRRKAARTGPSPHTAPDELPPLRSPLPPSRPLHDILETPTILDSQRIDGRREGRMGDAWGLFSLDLPSGACVVFRRVESAVKRWRAALGPDTDPEEPVPPELLERCVHGLPSEATTGHRASPGVAPTLAASPTSQLIILSSKCIASTAQLSELFGLPSGDPLRVALEEMHPTRAHSLLCRGISLHSSTAMFDFVQSLGVMPSTRPWRVATAFSGPGTFLAGLRAIKQKYILVKADDIDKQCRRLLLLCHPNAKGIVGRDSTCHASTFDALPADILLSGFPCVKVGRPASPTVSPTSQLTSNIHDSSPA